MLAIVAACWRWRRGGGAARAGDLRTASLATFLCVWRGLLALGGGGRRSVGEGGGLQTG